MNEPLRRRTAPPQAAGLSLRRPGWHASLLILFLGLLGLMGGTSRPTSLTLLLLRPASVITLGLLLIVPTRRDWRSIRIWLWLLGLFALCMAMQLIPLPPALWAALPGHEFALGAASLAPEAQPWRPISLTPDLTINSLLDLLPPLVVLIGYASIDHAERGWLAPLLVAIALASIVLGLVQLAGGPSSVAYIYGETDESLPVGLLSNRNHQALLLAIAIAVTGYLLRFIRERRGHNAVLTSVMAGGMALLFLSMIVASGSRTGLVFAGAAFVMAAAMNFSRHERRAWFIATATGVSLIVVVLIAVLLSGRGVAFARFSTLTDTGAEMRWRGAPIVLDQIRAFFPFGSGFGSFDSVFRMAEPDHLLKPTFFNHAHNDVLETLLCGGLPGLILLTAFAMVVVGRWYGVWRDRAFGALFFLGSITIVLTVGSSLVDYPLRTPLIAAIFTLACCWLRGGRSTPE